MSIATWRKTEIAWARCNYARNTWNMVSPPPPPHFCRSHTIRTNDPVSDLQVSIQYTTTNRKARHADGREKKSVCGRLKKLYSCCCTTVYTTYSCCSCCFCCCTTPFFAAVYLCRDVCFVYFYVFVHDRVKHSFLCLANEEGLDREMRRLDSSPAVRQLRHLTHSNETRTRTTI